MNMKIKYFSIVFLFFLVGCWNENDDSNIDCTSDCTNISGRIVTEDGSVPVGGLNFQLDWMVKGTLGGTYRNIKKFTTDKNGYFNINFHATDQELYFKGGYTIKYLGSDENFVNLRDLGADYPVLGYVYISKRDTLINKILMLPRRSYIKIKYNSNIQSVCHVYYKFGELSLPMFYNLAGEIYSIQQSEKIIETAGNQMNYLLISTQTNNNNFTVDDSIYVPIGDTIVYNIK